VSQKPPCLARVAVKVGHVDDEGLHWNFAPAPTSISLRAEAPVQNIITIFIIIITTTTIIIIISSITFFPTC
jgi:hypothetical protein